MSVPEPTDMEERRHLPRHRTFLQGRVFYNNRHQSADCIIRELTDDGARLSFTDPVALPHAFELHIPNRDQTARVETEWNHGTEIGVSFAKTDAHGAATIAPAINAATNEQSPLERIEKLEKELAALRRRISEIEMKSS
ncbi:MAG: PilZ domain-containing protein [Rhizobiales bacterium]|nr:PilZ domain-containing protein [Hyphomicrobiales bacterium]